MSFDPLIEPLIRSSKLPVYLEELNAFYAEEQKKRQEFYEWLDEEKKAEFIEGEVVVHSPARNKHIEVCGFLHRLLSTYVDVNDLGAVRTEKALVRLTRNDFEPDICFFKKAKAVRFAADTLFFPSPDFVVEVLSDTTEGRDRGVKFSDYALHGVAEYWIVNAEKEFIEQYLLEEGAQYELNMKAASGNIASRAIIGFTIPVNAIFDKEKNVAALQTLLAN